MVTIGVKNTQQGVSSNSKCLQGERNVMEGCRTITRKNGKSRKGKVNGNIPRKGKSKHNKGLEDGIMDRGVRTSDRKGSWDVQEGLAGDRRETECKRMSISLTDARENAPRLRRGLVSFAEVIGTSVWLGRIRLGQGNNFRTRKLVRK